jgi:hypothetical protein
MNARAYFAFTLSVHDDVAVAVERYIIDMLSRPTVSPEEIYYNMLRIDQSHQLIYAGGQAGPGACMTTVGAVCDDRAFVGYLSQHLRTFLRGWGYDGKVLVPYDPNGWLSAGLNHGQVWWLLFASRWGHDTKSGVRALKDCWKEYWSRGEMGGLGNTFCQNANDGSLPTKAEVDYAIYLVSGEEPAATNGVYVVPRLTLNDGR